MSHIREARLTLGGSWTHIFRSNGAALEEAVTTTKRSLESLKAYIQNETCNYPIQQVARLTSTICTSWPGSKNTSHAPMRWPKQLHAYPHDESR